MRDASRSSTGLQCSSSIFAIVAFSYRSSISFLVCCQ
ncbi:hypothetical protein T02_14354 [Trichinella nativa]|uniref:Uncharacterized protein n=1 Tax=Trichinella nativa TaxID=6335 RepID=A0A0V1KIK9_9BILA|nr:hypothetical protein T02_14354 [Trichinella nativa]